MKEEQKHRRPCRRRPGVAEETLFNEMLISEQSYFLTMVIRFSLGHVNLGMDGRWWSM